MTESLQKSITQEVKDFMLIQDECSAPDLFGKLREYRNQMHPDRFPEEKAKESANNKVKVANQLLEQLQKFIQLEEVNRKPAEISLYRASYDYVRIQSELDGVIAANKELTFENEQLKESVIQLGLQVQEKQRVEFQEERKAVEALYAPSTFNIASFGIIAALTLAAAIINKVEDLSMNIAKYSPFTEGTVEHCLFFLLIGITLLIFKEYIEHRIVKRKAAEVCTPKFSQAFYNRIKYGKVWVDGEDIIFLEADVYNFIEGTSTPWKNRLSALGFKAFQAGTIDRLKNLFISDLLNRKLIKLGNPSNLDRNFIVRTEKNYWRF